MAKNKKSIYIFIFFIFVFIIIISPNLNFFKRNYFKINQPNIQAPVSGEKVDTGNVIKVGGDSQSVKSTKENTDNIKVMLEVSDKKYEIEVKKDSTVFEAMENIVKESTNDNIFYFKYTEHPSLGFFITNINGAKGGSGKYWIYYVNGKEASVGVSKYVLRNGDIISWKLE